MTPLPRMEVFAKVTSVGAFGRAASTLLGRPLAQGAERVPVMAY